MISPFIMLGVGALLMAAELIAFSFYLLFFGLGFIVVGALNFGLNFAWQYQILAALSISLISLFSFRGLLVRKFSKKSEIKEDFLDERGVGVAREGMIYYKGTMWHYDGDKIAEGERVEIKGTRGNRVILG